MPTREPAHLQNPVVPSPAPGRVPAPVAAERRDSEAPSLPQLTGATGPLSPQRVLHLQRTVGNRMVGRLLASLGPGGAAGRIQRMTFHDDDNPANLPEDFRTLRRWAYGNAAWPKLRRMSDWIERVRGAPGSANTVEQWNAFNTALDGNSAQTAKYRLTVAVAALKAFIEATYEAALTEGELTEKDRLIDELIRAITPAALNAFARDTYKDALVAKVLASPRYLQSIKAKGPYVDNVNDDDARPAGINATRIRARVDVVRSGQNLYADLVPGANQEWEAWRRNDCVFAAILKVVLGDEAPTDEEADQEMATTLTAHLGLARGPVEDPVILFLMERLGWPYTGGKNWDQFRAWANQGKTYVLSASTVSGGTASHVVVATYTADAWTIYDRQGDRLGGPMGAPPFPNNPLDVWEVAESEAVGQIRAALEA